MKKFTYTNEYGDEVVFDNNPNSTQFLVSLTGLISKTEQYVKAIEQDGQKTLKSVYNARPLMAKMIYERRGRSLADYQKHWIEIVNAFAPKVKGTIKYQTESGTYLIDVMPLEEPELIKQQFTIQFTADFPFWRDAIQKEYVLGTVKPLWKFPATFANGPLKMGEWQKTFLFNSKVNADTPFILEIEGVGDYCKITNEKGKFMMVDVPITQGEKLIINTGNKTVFHTAANGIVTDANNKLTIDSDYLMFHRGENILTYDNGISSLPVATLKFAELYTGGII